MLFILLGCALNYALRILHLSEDMYVQLSEDMYVQVSEDMCVQQLSEDICVQLSEDLYEQAQVLHFSDMCFSFFIHVYTKESPWTFENGAPE